MENEGKIRYTRYQEEIGMKNKIFKGILAIILSLSLSNLSTNIKAADEEKRAVWVSYLDFQTNLKDKSESDFKAAFEKICQTAIANNLNTLIVHARAFNDAVYPSTNYPYADWLNTSQSNPGYDALAIMIEIAHNNNLKFEAWLNPYRISLTTSQTQRFLGSSHAKRFAGEDLIEYEAAGQTRMILNPASPNVQQSVVSGVEEIVRDYDVDGIHLDDYFYVNNTHGYTTTQERLDVVNSLVKKIYDKVKSIKPEVEFGISPAGNVDNCVAHGVDIHTWLSTPGYVDYVMPQIYWTDQYGSDGSVTMFTNRAKQWKTLHKSNEVKMYIGLGLYNVVSKPAGDLGWRASNDNMAKQVQLANSLGYEGYTLFRYDSLNHASTQTELKNLANKNIPSKSKFTWSQEGSTWYALDASNTKMKGWVKDEFQCWYFLDYNTGAMQTGWIPADSTHWYYLNPANGIMQTGLLTVDNEQYLLENTGQYAGSMLRNGTYTVGSNTCTIKADGVVSSC